MTTLAVEGDPAALAFLPPRDLSTQRIYGYRFKLTELDGRIKVGETGRTVKDRVIEQIKTAGLADLVEIVFSEPAIDATGAAFRDKDVHRVLKDIPGVEHLDTGGGSEWFKCDLDQVKLAYLSVVTGKSLERRRTENYRPRDEQCAAVERTEKFFRDAWAEDPDTAPRFLWNAKMRFGKTFAAYRLAQALGSRRVLVVTFKPAVADAWQTDLETHLDFVGWSFFTAQSLPEISRPTNYVYFASFQDLLGIDQATGTFKAKNSWIEDEPWDLVIFDEYHYGAWRYADAELFAGEAGGGKNDLANEYTAAVNLMEEEQDEWGKDEKEFLPFKNARAFLYLSGTPFRALDSGQFHAEQIYNWTYTDEQSAKSAWSPSTDQPLNPYLGLPEMHLLTYEVPHSMRAIASSGSRNEFDLNAFFKASGSGINARFDHEDHVQAWLTWLRGQDVDAALSAIDAGKPFPYSATRLLPYLDHTVWFLPSVAAVFAMKNLLNEPFNRSAIWGDFDVLAVAGEHAGIGADALPPVKSAIGSGYDTKTITLTCGKLLTGVTVPQWAAMLMLCNLTSPETYFQAAFRVQSAWTVKNPDGDDPNNVRVEKPACLVIDFAPSRALRLYADYGVRLGQGDDPQKDVDDLARFLPVLSFDGATLRHIDAGEILDIALQSAAVDTRQMDSLKYINPREGILARVDPGARAALDQLHTGSGQGTGTPNQPPTVIADDPDIKPTTTGPEESPQDEPDSEESDAADRSLARKLRFLAKRINAFMYLSRNYEKTLRDVLSTDEVDLFEKVMRLRPADMQALVDAGLFNEAALRLAILQFARAERDSLPYTGLDPWSAGTPRAESPNDKRH